MSKIGSQEIQIPPKTDIKLSDGAIFIKGPLGELKRSIDPKFNIQVSDNKVLVKPMSGNSSKSALWGTTAAHIKRMIQGVNKPFLKKLIIEGVGFKAEVKKDTLLMNLGFSHPIIIKIPEGVNVIVEKNVITISGISIEAVGQFAAKVRDKKKPEPYKGKGIKYENEIIRRKQGKKTV